MVRHVFVEGKRVRYPGGCCKSVTESSTVGRVKQLVIEVALFSSLRKYANSFSGIITADVSDDIDIREVLNELEIDIREVRLIKVNGVASSMNRILIDGDKISIYP